MVASAASPSTRRRPGVEAIETRRSAALVSGNRVGAVLISALLLTFAAQRALSPTWGAGIAWSKVAALVWFVGIGGALYAMRPVHHVSSPRSLQVETIITSIFAAFAIALLGLDLPPDARYLHTGIIALMAGFALLVPMKVRAGGLAIALMALIWPAVELAFGGASPTDPEFLLRVTDIAAAATISVAVLGVHTALFERRYSALADVARLADEDALTGVLNRRGLVDWLHVEAERARRYDHEIGVLVFDIDGFKSFNTRLGYLAGDRMLQVVASTLEKVLAHDAFARPGSTVGRYGGEEFVVMLPDADAALVRRFADETRAAIAAEYVQWDGEDLQVTVSVGVATARGDAARADALVAAADAAMYGAKADGGNRTTVATALPKDPTPLRAHAASAVRGPLTPTNEEAAAAHDDAVRLQLALLAALMRAACIVVLMYAGVDFALYAHPDWTLELRRVLPLRLVSASAGLVAAAMLARLPRTANVATGAHVVLVGAAALALLLIEREMGLPVPNFFAGMVLVVLSCSIALATSRAVVVTLLASIVVGYTVFTLAQVGPGESVVAALMRGGVLTSASVVALVAREGFVRLRRDEVVLRGRLDRLARLDPLTGLPNRVAFEQRMDRERARAAAYGIPLCIGLIDLDHFKALNDRAGHMAGDDALVALADTLQTALRVPDCAARLGGEEFAIVLPVTDIEGARAAMERLLDAVRDTRTPAMPDGLRASIGVVPVDPTASTPAALARADRALRAAKRAGRDRVVVQTGNRENDQATGSESSSAS